MRPAGVEMILSHGMTFPASQLDCDKNCLCFKNVIADSQQCPLSVEIFKSPTEFKIVLLLSFNAILLQKILCG